MDFRILGPLEALDRGRDLAPAGSKRRALLALLLLHANETLTIDRLVDELWGEHPPATAARTLQAHVSRLRKALDAGAGNGARELIVTITLTARRPPIQPSANADPALRAFGAPSTRTMAMIGIGLRATASAEGSRSPMTSFNRAASSVPAQGDADLGCP
jgi:Transcriptional regulatory protein, C terminal